MDDADRKRDGREGSDPMRYATAYHAPVLLKAVVEGLITDPAGVYVDATLGGGGHTAALLQHLGPEARVLGIDQDTEAIAEARQRLEAEEARGRFRAIQGNFAGLAGLLAEAGVSEIDGLLLDLGISSHQIDTAGRGFSYRMHGALDMRMDTRGGISAYDVVNAWDEGELRRMLHAYGEEPRAKRIARAIAAARPIETTDALAVVIRQAVPDRDEVKTLSRVFQAIRIAVNDELAVLEQVLEAATDVVRPGGRLAVISYHSLEDRRVKRFLRYGNLKGEPVRDFYGNLLAPWKEHTRRPIMADEQEVEQNPRARSARLRIAERTDVDRSQPPATKR